MLNVVRENLEIAISSSAINFCIIKKPLVGGDKMEPEHYNNMAKNDGNEWKHWFNRMILNSLTLVPASLLIWEIHFIPCNKFQQGYSPLWSYRFPDGPSTLNCLRLAEREAIKTTSVPYTGRICLHPEGFCILINWSLNLSSEFKIWKLYSIFFIFIALEKGFPNSFSAWAPIKTKSSRGFLHYMF